MSHASHRIGELVLRIQDAFLEIPGLTLTPRQARERFALDEATCGPLLGALAHAGVLTQTPDGGYVRFFRRAGRLETHRQRPHASRRRGRIGGRAGRAA